MANDLITLSLNKSTEPYDIETLTFGKPESNKIIDIAVVDKNGKPYDLTNKDIVFAEKFSDVGFGEIIDNGKSTNSGAFIRDPELDLQGKFKYRLQQNVFLGCGQAQFEFLQDGVVQDATNLFNIDIQTKLDLGYSTNNGSYISDFASLLAHFKLTISQANDKAEQVITDLQAKINSAITNGQKSIDNEVNDSNTKISELIDKTQKLIDSQTQSITDNGKKLSDLSTAWEEISKQIQKKADDEIASLQASFNTKMSELDTKAEDKIDSIKQIEETEIAQKADKTDLQALSSQLAAKVDQNNTYTKSEVDQALANAGKLKSISVNKGEKIQPDESGNVDITTPAMPDLSPYAKTVDLDAKLAKKADADNVTAELAKKADTQAINTALDTKANKVDVDKALASKANIADSYTKKEIDDKFANAVATSGNTKSVSVNGGTKSLPDQSGNIDIEVNEPDLTGYAKTADVNTELSKKANITDINVELAAKANKADVDSALVKKGEVKSVTVNGGPVIKPDDSGNVAITTPNPDLTAYAKTADVNAQLAAKADITDVDTKLSTKANSDDVTKSLADKANTADVVPKTDFTNLQNQYDALKTNYDDLKNKFGDIVKQLATKATIKYFKSDQADTARDWSGKTAYGIAIIDDTLANTTDSANASTTNTGK